MLYIKVETCFFFFLSVTEIIGTSIYEEKLLRRSVEHGVSKIRPIIQVSPRRGSTVLSFVFFFCLQNYKVVLIFESVDKIFQCSFQSNIQHSCKTVISYYASRHVFLTSVPGRILQM